MRRGLALYGFGLLFDTIWPGTILPYYGAMFVVAAVLFTLRGAVVLAIGVAAAARRRRHRLVGPRAPARRPDTSWLFAARRSSPRACCSTSFVNGTHPLLPWLAFFCAGIVLGRVLRTDWWRPAAMPSG